MPAKNSWPAGIQVISDIQTSSRSTSLHDLTVVIEVAQTIVSTTEKPVKTGFWIFQDDLVTRVRSLQIGSQLFLRPLLGGA